MDGEAGPAGRRSLRPVECAQKSERGGRLRFTRDIDSVVFTDALDFARKNRVLLLRHESSGIDVDVSFGILPFEQELIARTAWREVAGVRTPLPTVEDLIILEAVAHRSPDCVSPCPTCFCTAMGGGAACGAGGALLLEAVTDKGLALLETQAGLASEAGPELREEARHASATAHPGARGGQGHRGGGKASRAAAVGAEKAFRGAQLTAGGPLQPDLSDVAPGDGA